MKFCTKCKNKKETICFSKSSKYKDGLSYICKSCMAEYDKNKHLKYPWKRIFNDIRTRCENQNNKKYYLYGGRGIKNQLTLSDVEYLWYRDNAWLLDRPSIDRTNSNKNYTIENCEFIELSINSGKPAVEHCHKILQFNLDGTFIKEWSSAKDVGKFLNIHPVTINKICREGTTRTGFIWKYIKPIRKSPKKRV